MVIVKKINFNYNVLFVDAVLGISLTHNETQTCIHHLIMKFLSSRIQLLFKYYVLVNSFNCSIFRNTILLCFTLMCNKNSPSVCLLLSILLFCCLSLVMGAGVWVGQISTIKDYPWSDTDSSSHPPPLIPELTHSRYQ